MKLLKAAEEFLKETFWIFSIILDELLQLAQIALNAITADLGSDAFPMKCFKHLGCFSNGPPFYDPIFRKDSVLPKEQLGTNYFLFTRLAPDTSYNMSLNDKSIALSPFNASLPTKILVPGFLTKLEQDKDFPAMKDEILKVLDANVIIVDWSCSNDYPYNQAMANGRIVGAQVAYLLQLIKKNKNIDYKSVHIIGHSLGAHVAGWTGERLNKVGRITALDPAGPLFYHAPPPVRLDITDADFVDVIHTDAANSMFGGFGLEQRIGHLDFYPNNGSYQPACGHKKNISIFDIATVDACQHAIAKLYFMSSINGCVFLSVRCNSYDKFQKGECTAENSLVSEMGFYARKIENMTELPTFYLHTTANPPYCVTSNTKHLGLYALDD